jgi:hypothetical protein
MTDLQRNPDEPEYSRYCRRCEQAGVEPLPYDEYLQQGGVAGGSCLNCGYNLTGNLSGRCPECGVTIGQEGHRT